MTLVAGIAYAAALATGAVMKMMTVIAALAAVLSLGLQAAGAAGKSVV